MYDTRLHKTKQKTWQWVLINREKKEKRMYAIQTAEKYSPVKTLSNFISKTEQNAYISSIVQSQLGLIQYMNLSKTQIHPSNIINSPNVCTIYTVMKNAPRALHTKLTA